MTRIEHTFFRKPADGTQWQGTCSCGWESPLTGSTVAAENDWLTLHIRVLGVVGNWGGR